MERTKENKMWDEAIKAFQHREYQKAMDLFKKFIEQNPKEAEMVARAESYISICKKLMEKEEFTPKNYRDFINLGIYYINIKESKEAINFINRALEKVPKDPFAYFLMSIAYSQMGEDSKCFEFLKKAVEKDGYLKVLAYNISDFEHYWGRKEFEKIVKVA
ncbi:MAG: tetratricopeptide repeat protein [Candidatus Aminicenantia bacterium]